MIDEVVAQAAREELAHRNLATFASFVDPNYVSDLAYVRHICGVLEKMEHGEIRHLLLGMPPRHGKTKLVSQNFPAWWLSRHPRDEIILASNTAGLAEDNSGVVRNLLGDERYPFATKVSSDTFAKDLWRTTAGGVIRAAGIGSAIQGRGFHLGVIDDPIGGAADATDAAFERQWDWFLRDFYPRRLSDSHIIVSMFRWGDRDLAGCILAHEDPDFRKEWTVLMLPAYAREDDPLGRAVGEVLFPPTITSSGRKIGYGKDFLEMQRKADARTWAAQYELDPVPSGGLLFKAEWLTARYDMTPTFKKIVLAVDTAAKTQVKNDWSVIAVLGATKTHFYLLDVIRRKVEFPELQRMVMSAYRQHEATVCYIEDTSNGVALQQQLRRDSQLPVVPVKATTSKISRFEAITGIVESGRLVLPNSAPWLVEFEKELLRVPHAAHDDQVDAVALGLERLRAARLEESGWSFAIMSTNASGAQSIYREFE